MSRSSCHNLLRPISPAEAVDLGRGNSLPVVSAPREACEYVGLAARVVLARVDSLGREMLVGARNSASRLFVRSGEADRALASKLAMPARPENGLENAGGTLEGPSASESGGLIGRGGREKVVRGTWGGAFDRG